MLASLILAINTLSLPTVGDAAKVFFWFLLSIPMVEFVGYLWHRFIEHAGKLGETLRWRHYVHHELDYPAENLRPEHGYKNADAWSWYVLAAVTVGILLILVSAGILPLRYMVAILIGVVLYARYVVSIFHDLYHVRHPREIPDKGFSPFKFILRPIYNRLFGWQRFLRWHKKLVYLHDIHHQERCNYGIVFFWTDRLFGTFRKTTPQTPVNVFPGFQPMHRPEPAKQ